ncbi:hypothetical protein [Ferrimonas kyonanensis]|uniref:hypothetical protein n=1 Tax=Ferrimonas kyonanensis TaxID=364763 RepID=UPI0004891CB3|nr:hypothetical protein [Ferrimonas kyonanensis]
MRFVNLPDDMELVDCALCKNPIYRGIELLEGTKIIPICWQHYRQLQAKHNKTIASHKGAQVRTANKEQHQKKLWEFLAFNGHLNESFEQMATLANQGQITTSRGGTYTRPTIRRALADYATSIGWDKTKIKLPKWLKQQYQEYQNL